MGELSNSIRKITSNKNTVTVIGVILGIFVMYIAYTMRVHAAVSPISVPYAREQISPGTKISSDMIGTRDVPPSMLKGDVIRDYNKVNGKYSSINSVIPKGSLFYESAVVEKDQVPTNVILDYENGYELYNMAVTTATTYGNSMYPGNYIDIYLKAMTVSIGNQTNSGKEKKVVLGKLVQNVKVIAVKDYSGKAVFKNIEEGRQPAFLIFAVPADMYVLLKKAEYLRTYDSMLIPVPTRESLKAEPGEIKYSSEALKKWINDVTIWTS